jgi:SulP family sulfate permease
VVYALLGTSRQLAVGPVAMVSLLVLAGVTPIAGEDPGRYLALVLSLALMVGAIQFVLGLARFGFLTNFLSHPVLSGFTSAAALIIGFSQLKHLLGVPLPSSRYAHEILLEALASLGDVHAATLVIGILAILVLVALRRWKKTFPGALAVVALGTAAVWFSGLHEGGVRIVGVIPGGLPVPAFPGVGLSDLSALLPTALAISLVGFMESIAVAKAFAAKHRYRVDANRELGALGAANMVGALFQAYPTTGGFSRTAVNDQAGARTTVASLISAGVIALTLLFLTPLFRFLPQAVLAAIIVVAVAGLFDVREMRYLWRVKRTDFALLVVTFVATLALGIEEGILVGVVASLVLVIHETSRPHTAILGRLPGTDIYRNVARNPDAVTRPDVAVVRVDAALYFGNVEYVRDRVLSAVGGTEAVHTVIFDAYAVNRIDATAAHALLELSDVLRDRGVRLIFAGVKGPVMDVLQRAGVEGRLGSAAFLADVHAAVTAVTPEPRTEHAYEHEPVI